MCGMWLVCVSVPVCVAVVRSGLSDLSCPSADERESARDELQWAVQGTPHGTHIPLAVTTTMVSCTGASDSLRPPLLLLSR